MIKALSKLTKEIDHISMYVNIFSYSKQVNCKILERTQIFPIPSRCILLRYMERRETHHEHASLHSPYQSYHLNCNLYTHFQVKYPYQISVKVNTKRWNVLLKKHTSRIQQRRQIQVRHAMKCDVIFFFLSEMKIFIVLLFEEEMIKSEMQIKRLVEKGVMIRIKRRKEQSLGIDRSSDERKGKWLKPPNPKTYRKMMLPPMRYKYVYRDISKNLKGFSKNCEF